MENVLKSINSVMGVIGCFVSNGEGRVLASAMPQQYNEITLSAIGRTINQTMAGLTLVRRRKVGDIDLVYERARFIAIDLGEGSLCVMCGRNINVPLLSITTNLAAKKLVPMVKESTEIARKESAGRETWLSDSILLKNELYSIISTSQKQGIILRATNDAGVRLHCPSAVRLTPLLDNKVLDLAGRKKQSGSINNILKSLGYLPEVRFNSLYGDQRLRFVNKDKNLGLEVYLDTLKMYHQLNFADRLNMDQDTISLADLLLWKLQNVESNDEIMKSIYLIVCDHELGKSGESERIELPRILSLCSNDWGWYKTVTLNLNKCLIWATTFTDEKSSIFLERARRLIQLIEETPKTGGWQLRARVGESVRWYETPD